MKWLTKILSGFRKKIQPPAQALTQEEIDIIVALASVKRAPGYRYWVPKATLVYRNALRRGVPMRSNIYMTYMAEVDHPCPDLVMRREYREKIRAMHPRPAITPPEDK